MASPDDPPRSEDEPTEWLSPALYRRLCDAVDEALAVPPDARERLLAERLGGDPRLTAEATALLASHDPGANTVVRPPPADEENIHESATVVVKVPRPAVPPLPPAGDDATMAIAMPAWVENPPEPEPPRPSPPEPEHAGHGAASWESAPVPSAPYVAPPAAPPTPPPQESAAIPAASYVPPPAAPPAAPSRESQVPAADAPAPPVTPTPPVASRIPARSGGGGLQLLTAASVLLLVVTAAALAAALWFWRQADQARTAAEARLEQAERRFNEVRQLGVRLAETDRLLAVTSDPGAQAARAVLVRTWMQYLQDLQRASGGTDRELLLEVARGYRQIAASQGGIGGRTLGDHQGAARTLQIGIRLLEYLDRTARQPDLPALQELSRSLIDLGDVAAAGKDAAGATAHYRKALEVTERLSSAAGGDGEAARTLEFIRQRIQSGPPAPPSSGGADAAASPSAPEPKSSS